MQSTFLSVGATIFSYCGLTEEDFTAPSKTRIFDPKLFLSRAGLGRTILQYPKNKVIFAQGGPSEAVFYIQSGRAKLTVVSTHGKEATIALLGEGDFRGRGVSPSISRLALRLPPQLQIVVY